MSTNKLTSIIRRGTMFGAVFAIVAATFAPASLTFADALNPLTDRSLTLSSSAPGWDFKDGSGNTTYAPPNSGANGQKTGNTFAFKVSSDTATSNTLKGITFQYCTKSAGPCIAPGNIAAHGPNNAAAIAAKQSDLEIVTSSPTEVDPGDFGTYINAASVADNGATPNVDESVVAGSIKSVPTGANFVVYYQTAGVNTPTTADDVWTQSTGWDMTATESQVTSNGKDNQISLVHAGTGFAAGTPVKIQFFATATNYITNPGEGAFFVKINTFRAVNVTDPTDPQFNFDTDVIDGGVTVANVMNLSIQITTKVLETMEFSVGTVDPNTLDLTQLAAANGNNAHSPCDRILTRMDSTVGSTETPNVLKMGSADAEFSLETDKTYSTHSYWRLSSNSSAGATVYYSGNTLSNTVGDKIKAIGAVKQAPIEGSEQFGLALANGTTDANTSDAIGYLTNYSTETHDDKVLEYGADDEAAGLVALRDDEQEASPTGIPTGTHSSVITNVGSNPSYHQSQLYPLIPAENYNDGAGSNNLAEYGAIDTAYAFDETSQQIPVALATEESQVVDCVTGKMRYIGNIAATTPAGIYTTKINYIAAPQY